MNTNIYQIVKEYLDELGSGKRKITDADMRLCMILYDALLKKQKEDEEEDRKNGTR